MYDDKAKEFTTEGFIPWKTAYTTRMYGRSLNR
jgi:hypothetical protein